jgi:hypothetical protein
VFALSRESRGFKSGRGRLLSSVTAMDSERAFDDGTENSVSRALTFGEQLTARRICYDMDIVRDTAVMVTVAVAKGIQA